MEFKEYLKEQISKVETDNDNLLLIYLDGDVQFKYHKNCFADFQEDFCILYDDDVSMAVRYDAIRMVQYCPIKEAKEMFEEMFEDIFKSLTKD